MTHCRPILVKKGYTAVILKGDLTKQLKAEIDKEYADTRKPKPELSTYVQSILWDVLDGKLVPAQ